MNRKKLIEVALPLEPINAEALHRKQKAPKGWPTSFHKWWAQRPLASARAVIFAQMVDDPSSNPDLFPTEQDQERERNRLFKIIEDLVKWENTHNHQVLRDARNEIWKSWRRSCAENADHPEAEKLFNPDKLPAFCDPFAGSGSLPLSAQWFGINAYAADLNPVAVLINKAMIEIPPRFAGREPVNPEWNTKTNEQKALALWKGAQGLADDVRYYGQWMREEAEKRIGHVYPKLEITAEIAKDRPDLRSYVGHQVTVIAWLWVRTVKSPNPAFAQVDVPLASTFMLSTKTGKEAYVEPVIEDDGYRFAVKTGKPKDPEAANQGTKLSRGANFRCVMSGTPISGEYIKTEGKGGRMGARLMAIVAEGTRGRFYVAPTNEQEAAARQAAPAWTPNVAISGTTQYLGVKPYGLEQFSQIYTNRQLLSLATISDLVVEARERIRRDATVSGLPDDNIFLRDGGTNATAYADAIAVYLACVLDRMTYYGSSLTSWLPKDNALRDSMPRQALAMTWDFAEGNPLGHSSGDILTCTNSVSNYLNTATPNSESFAVQLDAQTGFSVDREFIISTDPPYYDNVPYADLSDFFYVWLRRSLRPIFPGLFSTMVVPKNEELVAFSYRHKDKSAAETFFLNGMTQAMRRLARQAHPDFPVSIYYAFKQAESDNDIGTASTGWETFLAAVILAGFTVTGTWPLRTEGAGRIRAKDSNALASSSLSD
jgi:putative DNA methylase